ncbi:MAG: hypothetical protein GWO10_19630 [candidate division Zixibacteria bacterium]|nr:hypothetical protein [candidate division Zixibacteria bacterium]NIW47029.1 hypothetical protein [Gammaproteobacteria bacterium]
MNTKRKYFMLIVILVAAAMLWTSSATADGGGFPTATPTVTSTPEPTNTLAPTDTQEAAQSAEELDQFLQELDQADGVVESDSQDLDAVPISSAQQADGGVRNWIAIFLIATTIVFVAAGLVAVYLFYQRSRSGRSM